MMSGDCQSQGLAEWLQVLGWTQSLKSSDLRKLNTPKMRSIWRHLQGHVVPPHKSSVIRKNVLLARLEEENISFSQFQNFTLDSVNDLRKMKEIFKIEGEKDIINEEIKIIDHKLCDQKSSLLHKFAVEQWQRQKLGDSETKTMILELKHTKLLKDIKKVNDSKELVIHLTCPKTSNSQNERNHQKSLVCKYVKNYIHPLKDNEDEGEYLCELMGSILEFKPDTVLDGITQNAKEALRSLNSKIDNSVSKVDTISSKKTITFQNKLRDLKILVIRNELRVCEFHEKIAMEQGELQKEKLQLVEMFSKKDDQSCNPKKIPQSGDLEIGGKENFGKEMIETDNVDSTNMCQLLNNFLEKIQQERKNNKIQIEQIQFMSTDTDLDILEELERSLTSLATKEDELWREVGRKVNEVNMLATEIYRCTVDTDELNEILAEISQIASDFKTETTQVCLNYVESNKFTEMVLKEVEVFQRTPIVALQRTWDTSNKMLQMCSTKKFSENPLLLSFLLQAEEKNSIVNVLVKYLWSLSINPQFH